MKRKYKLAPKKSYFIYTLDKSTKIAVDVDYFIHIRIMWGGTEKINPVVTYEQKGVGMGGIWWTFSTFHPEC